jgi:TetR/AcrR family transcriptional regulator, ethionamide resistance regulator
VTASTLALVRDKSFTSLSVDELARAAGLTRTAFYFYFRDKRDLLMVITEEVVDALYEEADRWWHGEGSPEETIRAGLEGVVGTYERYKALLGVANEVSSYDDDVRLFWRSLMERFITATRDQIRSDQAAGRTAAALDPATTAAQLVWMVERCCYVYLTRDELGADELADSLTRTWVQLLYAGD